MYSSGFACTCTFTHLHSATDSQTVCFATELRLPKGGIKPKAEFACENGQHWGRLFLPASDEHSLIEGWGLGWERQRDNGNNTRGVGVYHAVRWSVRKSTEHHRNASPFPLWLFLSAPLAPSLYLLPATLCHPLYLCASYAISRSCFLSARSAKWAFEMRWLW